VTTNITILVALATHVIKTNIKLLRDGSFNFQGEGGYGFYLKKYSDSQFCWKNILILVEKKIIIWFRVLSYNLMLNSGKKSRFARQKKNILTLVLSEKKILDEKKTSCKLNDRSLIKMQISNLERFWIE
jgi:hypothetical protein